MIITQAERDYWIRIENLSQYLVQIPNYHPDHPKYVEYWKEQKRRCIEGIWGLESKGHRYCPGTIYFYGNFYSIVDVDQKQKTRKIIKPLIRDIEWHRAYNFIVAQGFSGFSDDDVYSCDRALIDDVEMDEAVRNTERYESLLDSKGKLKQYVNPLNYVKQVFDKPKGFPLYWNKALNISELGCLGAETKVRMFDGSVKEAQYVQVGDLLMGPDSTSREVKELVRGKNLLYEINDFVNKKYVVSDTHTLRLYNLETCTEEDVLLEDAVGKYYMSVNNKNGAGVINVTPLQVGDFYGFEVDKDHLFVLEDYTVTHNSRGGGKSYWYSGLAARELLIDGQKYYDPLNKNLIIVAIGSGNTDKSSDLAQKIQQGINQLAENPALGVYGQIGENDFTPCPLYKNMTGDITPNNKTNMYRHEYKIKHKGEEIKKGSKCAMFHVSYAIQKKGGGAESAAGGRYNISIIEEVGLTVNALEVHYSNRATLRTDGIKFGVECYIGTSGNMELAQGAKKIFEHPDDYECLSFFDVFEGKGKIGFFLPSYMVDVRFKDADGNTDLDKAKTFYLKELDSQRTAEARNAFKMNYPIVPSDMWITKENSLLPKQEAERRLKDILTNNKYKDLRTFVNLKWNNDKIAYTIIDESKAIKIDSFRESQGSNEAKNKGLKSTKCDFIIYEFPQADAHPDSYKFIGLDPYVADETDAGESLGAMYILKSPKYIHEGQTGDIIVAEYVAKPGTRDDYSRNVEMLLAFYNNPRRALMFETNRGEKIEEYFKKVNKEYLLAYQPYKYVDGKVKQSQILKYGYNVGNQIDKLELMNQFAEWLRTHTTMSGETKMNIDRISSLGLLDEIINYDWEADKNKAANYDRISAMLGCMVARKEGFNQLKDNTVKKPSHLEGFLKDPRLKNYNIKV